MLKMPIPPPFPFSHFEALLFQTAKLFLSIKFRCLLFFLSSCPILAKDVQGQSLEPCGPVWAAILYTQIIAGVWKPGSLMSKMKRSCLLVEESRGSAEVQQPFWGSVWRVEWWVGVGPSWWICPTLCFHCLGLREKKCRCGKFVCRYLSLSQACGKKMLWREWWGGTICRGGVSDSVCILHVITLDCTLLLFAFLSHCHFQ